MLCTNVLSVTAASALEISAGIHLQPKLYHLLLVFLAQQHSGCIAVTYDLSTGRGG